MKAGPELRRANLRVLLAMAVFCLLLAAVTILWMMKKVRAQNAGLAHPTPAFVAAV